MKIAVLLLFVSMLTACTSTGGSAISAEDIAYTETLDSCRTLLFGSVPEGSSTLDSGSIDVLNWNVKKGSMLNWSDELESLSQGKDLVLIQEARENMKDVGFFEGKGFWSFAPGYTNREGATGVATFSATQPIAQCNLAAVEPWLRTPKATSITRYALTDTDKTLIVVNIHMINFTLGTRKFHSQLEEMVNLISEHDGPLIVSGDFNTWRSGRQSRVLELMTGLGLVDITFTNDKRVRYMGSPLDHVFIGGLQVNEARTFESEASDHNPIAISLSAL